MDTTTEVTERCMQLLAHGVPLSLLCDLTSEQPPMSAEVLEREVADTAWIRRVA